MGKHKVRKTTSSKARYSKEAWARRLAYGRAYRAALQSTPRGKKKLKEYRARWYAKRGKLAATLRRRRDGISYRGEYNKSSK